MNKSLKRLINEWRTEAETLRGRYSQEDLAQLCEAHAEELEARLGEWKTQLVNLTQASEISGYSADHVGRLVREGKLRNYGRKNAPLVRVIDLPYKVGHIPPEGAGVVSRRWLAA